MMPKRPDDWIRAFGMSGLQITIDLEKIEKDNGINLGIAPKIAQKREVTEYEQFESDLREEAVRMSESYEVFYCLENSIRKLVKDMMVEDGGADWWDSDKVNEEQIRKKAATRHKKEVDRGITPRSEEMIDYTTFGELSKLITDNWEIFAAVFSSKRAVSHVTSQLNILRAPIAHCTSTEALEKDRLNLAVRSWFQLMS